jgi:site-specific DNA-methyltransferase (adenine-specific)
VNNYLNKIIQGDCLEVMKQIPDKSIDMILCDLPYGTTACHWDTIIPFEQLWAQYKGIIKNNGAIVLTASQPFTSALVMSNIKMFKYEWIWDKLRGSGFNYARYQPMRQHENILVFYEKPPAYNSDGELYEKPVTYKMAGTPSDSAHMTHTDKDRITTATHHKKTSVIQFKKVNQNAVHPTQKPVALFEYLIRTYTNSGDLVLDNCIGSGTTAIACMRTGRNFIGIEQEQKYVDIANKRIEEEKENLKSLFP